MSIAELQECAKEFLVPEDIAPIIGCAPYSINLQAQDDAAKLGFPVSITGTRVRIPRRAFLRWLEYGNAPVVMTQ